MRTKQTIGSIVLGCIIASLTVLAGLIAWLGTVMGIVAGVLIAVGVITTYLLFLGPWQRRWGATDQEVARAMPGDGLLRPGAPSTTRAITIDASPETVFPWLLQIGYGRGGWYSFDWIDNDRKPSVEWIDPALQRLAVGDRIEMLPGFGPVVREIEHNHHLVSGGETDSWCLLVEPTTDGQTRLISRWRQDWPRTAGTYVWIAVADPGAFLMEQKMLRRIRRLAEMDGTAPGLTGGSRPTFEERMPRASGPVAHRGRCRPRRIDRPHDIVLRPVAGRRLGSERGPDRRDRLVRVGDSDSRGRMRRRRST